MVWLGLLVLIVALMLLRQSLVLVLAVATAYVHVFVANSKIEFLIQDFWFTVDREVLLSVPLFMLAGNVMSRGSIAKRLINFMSAFTAPIPGGLAVACVLACGAFAAINGSSIVTMLAIGTIMYPALVARGYSQSFSIGAIASAGTLGIIIPPSIPLILYGIMTEENIAHLFVAGIGPGLLLMTMFAVYSFWVNRHIPRTPFSLAEVGQATYGGIFAILLPFIMIGGIYTGWFSPTEAGAVSLAYALLIEFFVHAEDGAKPAPAGASFGQRVRHYLATREMGVRTLIDVILETTKLLATLLPLLCIAGSLNTILDHSGVPKQMVQSLSEAITSPALMMVGINILLLIVGCLMDVGSAILILAPLLKPLAVAIGTDPVHFGIIMISNLEIGYLTPPVGLNLIVAMAAFKVAFGTIVRSVLPFVAIMLVWLVIVIVYPTLSLGLLGQMNTDAALRERAARVIPGGLWGHMRVQSLPQGYPQFFSRAHGCRLWDADGREFIDFMCSWGPVVLGHHDAEVEAAADAQSRLGDTMNGPAPVLVELAEHLTGIVAHADWALFAKNGSDATTICVTTARAATGRRKLLVARGAYHGAAPWCTPNPAGVTAEDRVHLVPYRYNDSASLEQAAQQCDGDLAGVLASAFRHDYGVDQELPTREFAQAARALCDRTGAALILDEVRAGGRLDLAGSWEHLGVRPDLAAWSKAIANGHALAAVTGNDRFRSAAASIFVTGSFWCGAVAMAAALATLRKLQAVDGIAHMRAMGQRLRDGLARQAAAHGFGIRQSGPPQMPMLLFDNDPDAALGSAFCALALEQGVYLHPKHNMFLSVAHRPQDIDQALDATDRAFAALAR